MKNIQRIVLFIALIAPYFSASGQSFKPPGTEERAALDQATARMESVYKTLLQKLDSDEQEALKEAQDAWKTWSSAEAYLVARLNGSIGGSALRVDVLNAQLTLTRHRIEILSEYLKRRS